MAACGVVIACAFMVRRYDRHPASYPGLEIDERGVLGVSDAVRAPTPAAGQLSPEYRVDALRQLARSEQEPFDLLVIGGGATGCGAALDAASRGLRTALVEQRDLSSGTSSRSSKLVHGGLRYLEQLRFGLVREALRERELLLTRLAPHLVHPVSFLYPLRHPGWERPYVGAGIALYDVLGGARGSLPRHRHLSRTAALELAPALAPHALTGGIRYFDAQMDDARLAVAIARTAAAEGATVTTGTAVVGLLREGERVVGALVRDEETGEVLDVRARAVLACVGVWTDELRALLGGAPGPAPLTVRASKGVHLVVPRAAIDSTTGLILRTERSVLVVVPWEEHWIVGTTDTPWEGDRAEPAATSTDVDYLLQQVNPVLARPLTREDVVGVYAGLRPLADTTGGRGDTTKVSREHVVAALAPGLTAIAGGKWTTYRVMAADAVELAVASGTGDRGTLPPSRTADLPLLGATGRGEVRDDAPALAARLGLPAGLVLRLAERYGGLAGEVLGLIGAQPGLARPLRGAPGHVAAEVVHACRYAGARHLDDVLDRRLRRSLVDPDVVDDTAEHVAELMAGALGWEQGRRDAELGHYRAAVAAFREATTRAAARPLQRTRRLTGLL